MIFEFNKQNTFCISLESNTVRWSKMERRFNKCNLNVTRWNASDQYNLVDDFYNGLNNGQKGCSQSHILIYKHIIEFNLPYALILEDDACFDIHWRTKLNEFTTIDNDWDLIILNGSEPIHPSFKWVLQKEQYLTAGYIISNKGALHILNNWRGCYHASDWMTTRLQLNGHSYCYFPWLIIQEGKDSNIGEQVTADHEKVIRCLNEIDYSLENYVI
jgi:glycosyl transferase family 25